MKTTIVSLSEVRKGNGCLLAARFLGGCCDCNIVARCPNEQAIAGRVKHLESVRVRELALLNETDKLLLKARWSNYAHMLRSFVNRILGR